MNSEDGMLLRIFISETDSHNGLPLYEWIVDKARETGMAGATVLRGMQGFGAESHMHTSKILRLSQNLPIILELIDTEDKIEVFLPIIETAVGEGLVTTEAIAFRRHRTDRDTDAPGD